MLCFVLLHLFIYFYSLHELWLKNVAGPAHAHTRSNADNEVVKVMAKTNDYTFFALHLAYATASIFRSNSKSFVITCLSAVVRLFHAHIPCASGEYWSDAQRKKQFGYTHKKRKKYITKTVTLRRFLQLKFLSLLSSSFTPSIASTHATQTYFSLA